jgi:hypothetical protein
MAQTSWAADTTNWSTNSYLWYNTTYQDEVVFGNTLSNEALPGSWNYIENTWATYAHTWDYVAPDISYFTISKQGNITLGSEVSATGSGGFSLVGHANFDLGAGSTSSSNTIFVNSITFDNNTGVDSVGNMPITGSIILASGVYIQQSDLSVWSTTSETWAASTDTWNYGATVAIPVSADLAQINLSELHEEDAEKIASAVYALATGAIASGSVSVPVSATLANNQNLKFNINFEESITITGTSNITSSNNFLWNDQEEDTSTTWTKVADPDA